MAIGGTCALTEVSTVGSAPQCLTTENTFAGLEKNAPKSIKWREMVVTTIGENKFIASFYDN